MTKLHALSFRARALALNSALFVELVRFGWRRRASRPRSRPARSRFALSGFHRFACLLMVAVMFA